MNGDALADSRIDYVLNLGLDVKVSLELSYEARGDKRQNSRPRRFRQSLCRHAERVESGKYVGLVLRHRVRDMPAKVQPVRRFSEPPGVVREIENTEAGGAIIISRHVLRSRGARKGGTSDALAVTIELFARL